MSSDNQFTAIGKASVGFQTDSASIDFGASIAGNTCGAQTSSMFSPPNIVNMPSGVGSIALGDTWGAAGISGDAIKGSNGNIDGLGIPFTVDYGVIGVASKGIGVLGASVALKAPIIPIIENVIGPGVMGICMDGVGVKGVSSADTGVTGVSENDVGVRGTSPNDPDLKALSGGPAGVEGISKHAGVRGISTDDRGGVFTSKKAAQVQLTPKETKLASPIRALPSDGVAGDLIAIKTLARGKIARTSLWFCVAGKGDPGNPGPGAQWGQVNLTPIVQT